MKKLLSIVLSIVLLASMIPVSSYGKTEVNQAVSSTASTLKTYSPTGADGTYNKPIVMYVGDSIKLSTKVDNRGVFRDLITRWKLQTSFGSDVVAVDVNEQRDVKSQDTIVTAKSTGSVRVNLEWKKDYKHWKWEDTRETEDYFYITVIERPESAGTNQVGNVSFSKSAEWVNYNEGIAKITLTTSNTETIQGSDVILLLDKSSSMAARWSTVKKAAVDFTNSLLSNPAYNNRVSVISFAGDVSGSFNFKKDLASTLNSINKLAVLNNSEANGTNYALAFQQAINYANSRTETDRPLQIVFLSDGEPTSGNNGKAQFTVLNSISENEKAIGINLNKSGSTFLRNMFGNANYYATNGSNTDLAAVLSNVNKVIGEKHSGLISNVNISDQLADDYTLVTNNPLYGQTAGVILPPSGSPNPQVVHAVLPQMNPEQIYTFSYHVRISDTARVTDSTYPVGTEARMNYASTGISGIQSITAVNPSLQTKTGKITVEYREEGTNDLVDSNDMVNLPIQNDPHVVTPSAPRGYELVDAQAVSQTLTFEDNHKTVVFYVNHLPELYVNYHGMDGVTPIVDNNAYYTTETVTIMGDFNTIMTHNGIQYRLMGWTEDESLTTNERVFISSKGEYDNFDFIYPGDGIVLGEENLDLYAVWVPEAINETFNVKWMNDTEEFKPEAYEYDHDYAYGDSLLTFTEKPARQETVAERFNFLGWTLGEKDDNGNYILVDVSKVVVDKDLTFTAVYGSEPRSYRVQILNADNSILSDAMLPYGSSILFKTLPTIPDEMQQMGYVFTFQSWVDQATDETVVLSDIDHPVTVGGEVVYKAVFAKNPRTDLSFRINFVNAAGNTIAPSYERQGTAVFGETYEITAAMLPTGLTGYVARANNPKSIVINNPEINQVNYVYDAVVTPPVTPVNPTTPVTPTAPAAAPTVATTTPTVTPAVTPQTPVVIPTPETPQAETPQVVTPQTPQEDQTTVDIADEETPKAESALSWAFMNLLMAILTTFASAVVWVMFGIGKKRQNQKTSSRKMMFSLFSLLPAIASVIAFIATENVTNPMIMMDKWTLMMVLIAVVQMVVVVFAVRKTSEASETVER